MLATCNVSVVVTATICFQQIYPLLMFPKLNFSAQPDFVVWKVQPPLGDTIVVGVGVEVREAITTYK
jgi:hypothetical protein